jgi:protein TonB
VSHAQNLFNISAADRLGLTLFFAIALHAIIILGVGFNAELIKPEELPITLEITLVHSSSEEAPEKADYLAQANQQGGGNMKEKIRPSSPFPNPRPVEQEGDAPQTQLMQLPEPSKANEQPPVLLAQKESSLKWQMEKDEPSPEMPDTPNPTELMMSSLEMARTMSSLEQRQQTYAKMPREKILTANTRKSSDAFYLANWQQKVERIGTLNYPDEARSRGLSGNLLLDVVLNPDGSVRSASIERSSGHKALDDGALRIVHMAAPFAKIPPEVLGSHDVLRILRTWQFENDFSLRTR